MQHPVLIDFSEERIRTLHIQFRSMKRYLDRLAFYDRHFGIVPFIFPAFDPELPYFFESDKTEALVELMLRLTGFPFGSVHVRKARIFREMRRGECGQPLRERLNT